MAMITAISCLALCVCGVMNKSLHAKELNSKKKSTSAA